MADRTRWLIALLMLTAGPEALAERLTVAPDAPAVAHIGASIVLYLHIIGGAIGLATGVAASLARKGGSIHRAAGKAFVVAMFVTYLIGAGVAPFLTTGQRPNFVAGVLALYLLISGVATARRRPFRAGMAERVGLVVAITITGMGLYFMQLGASSATGTVDGSPPQAFVLFTVFGLVAAIGELNAILRGTLSPAARTSRHLWRMCASFFIASGSLFLGQPQIFPQAFNDSAAPFVLAFAPLLVMVLYLLLVRFKSWRRQS